MRGPLAVIPLPNIFFDAPIAHRGLHDCDGMFGSGRSENSFAAFRMAIEHGYGIEVDIQLSADGVPIVFHDYTLKRMFRINKKVSDLPLEVLKRFRLENKEEIPTLEEFLKLVLGKVPILVELKDQDWFADKNMGVMESAVAKRLENYDGPVAVMSFNPRSVKTFGCCSPNIPRGLVTEAFDETHWLDLDKKKLMDLRSLVGVDEVSASFISHECSDLDSDYLSQIPKYIKLFSWTIRNEKELKLALKTSDNVTFEGFIPR